MSMHWYGTPQYDRERSAPTLARSRAGPTPSWVVCPISKMKQRPFCGIMQLMDIGNSDESDNIHLAELALFTGAAN
jgi:hypothetical protein